jgi:hypothetical protein
MDRSSTIKPRSAPRDWLIGGGEMGALIRSMDWSRTPLGSRETWPQNLRTMVNLCLASNFPISIAWGPRRVQIHNDGYWPVRDETGGVDGLFHPATEMTQKTLAEWRLKVLRDLADSMADARTVDQSVAIASPGSD